MNLPQIAQDGRCVMTVHGENGRQVKIGVVIPTFNRKREILGCLSRVVECNPPFDEVIVVDDASTDGTRDAVRQAYPGVQYVSSPRNSGPCAARNLGLRVTTCDAVLMLDSDDSIHIDAVQKVRKYVPEDFNGYPAWLFLRSNARVALSLASPVHILTIGDLITGRLVGDTTEVISVKRFKNDGYEYPDTGAGGEHLLWYRLALDRGIPLVRSVIVDMGETATNRLTSPGEQVKRSLQNALLQERTLAEFGHYYRTLAPRRYRQTLRATATYWLLSNRRREALRHILEDLRKGPTSPIPWLLLSCLLLPTATVRWLFIKYRQATRKWGT